MKQWTEMQLEKHLKKNTEDYNSKVVVAMLYKKLYGKFPKIGMSGQQAEFADSVIDNLPEAINGKTEQSPVQRVTELIKNDEELYYGYQSNIAMAFKDEYDRNTKKYKNRQDIHKIANNAAKHFLNLWISA